MKLNIIVLLILVSGVTHAESTVERVRISGFHCDYGKAAVELRSLGQDRILYLASNEPGDPKYFRVLGEQCAGLVKNLGLRLGGRIFDLSFDIVKFSRKEEVRVSPRNSCRLRRPTCDDEGSSVERTFEYERTETFVDGFRFFSEQRTGLRL